MGGRAGDGVETAAAPAEVLELEEVGTEGGTREATGDAEDEAEGEGPG